MIFYLLLLFTVVPLVELALLIWIGQQTSLLFTIGLVLLTGFVGAALARWQGWQTVARIQRELADNKMPTDALIDGLFILLAGAMLITPGILTDLVGFSFLVPPLRRLVRGQMKKWFIHQMHVQTVHFSDSPTTGPDARRPGGGDRIIDAEVITKHVVDRQP